MKVKSFTIAASVVLYLAGWALGAGTIQDSKTFRADDFTIGEVVEQDKETYATVVPTGGLAWDYAGVPGDPELPIVVYLYSLPYGTEVDTVVVDYIGEELLTGLDHTLHPVQAVAESHDSLPPFVPPGEIYKQEGPYPAAEGLARGTVPVSFMRGAGIATIQVFPVRFDPENNKLNLVSQIQFTIILRPASQSPFPPLRESRIRHEEFVGAVEAAVENPTDVEGNLPDAEIMDDADFLPGNVPPECIVITGTDLVDSWNDYRIWMTRKGVPTEVVTVDWIYEQYGGDDHAEKIRNFIIDSYANPDLSRHFVVLGGNVDIVPKRLYLISGHEFMGDIYFATFDGNDDIGAEVSVARVPVENAQDVTNWVAKRLRFEINPGNEEYFNKILISRGNRWLTAEYRPIMDFWLDPIPFNVDRNTLDASIHTELDEDVALGQLENGLQFFVMMNEGRTDKCYLRTTADFQDPEYWLLDTGDFPDDFTAVKDHFTFSPACWLGNLEVTYDPWTPPPGGWEPADGCFAQVDLCSPNGSVAGRYNSRYGLYSPSAVGIEGQTLSHMLIDRYNIGQAHYITKLSYPAPSDDPRRLVIGNNLFGCPELRAWTLAPLHFSVTHPCGINFCPSPPPPPPGCQNVTVNVDVTNYDTQEPVFGALVTLWKEGEVYLRQQTDVNGHVSLTPGPSTEGHMLITCTMQNYIPYQCSILVSNTISCGHPPDSLMERPGASKVATLLPALIWNPHNLLSGDSLYQTLLRANYAATLTSNLAPFLDSLVDYHLYVVAGIWECGESELTWAEFQPFWPAIHSFLADGGSIYWEGVGAYTLIYYYASGLYDYFQAVYSSGGLPIRYLQGRESALYGPVFADIDSLGYSGSYTGLLESECGLDEAIALLSPGSVGYATAAIICQVAQTHTMLCNFSWARLNDSGTNTRVDLIHDVMDWLSGAVAVEEPEPLPREFSLSQNYPNPFNAQTTIDYALPKGGPIMLQVYDICGRVMATLVQEVMPAGYHQTVWDTKGISSGLYFLRIQAGEFAETKKMTLVK